MSKTESSKTDGANGMQVHAHLKGLGIETPMIENLQGDDNYPSRRHKIEGHMNAIMGELGLDLTDDSLIETPKRVSKMFMGELFWGLDYANFPKATVVENKMHYDEMVLERNITVYSMCEHHFLPIMGGAYVAYIPDKLVLGLSKLNRIVEFFSRRPQIQERLTAQIFHSLCFILQTKNVAVCITAEHLCVKIRGVEDACSDTVTTQLGGAFKDHPQVRAEFFSTINLGK